MKGISTFTWFQIPAPAPVFHFRGSVTSTIFSTNIIQTSSARLKSSAETIMRRCDTLRYNLGLLLLFIMVHLFWSSSSLCCYLFSFSLVIAILPTDIWIPLLFMLEDKIDLVLFFHSPMFFSSFHSPHFYPFSLGYWLFFSLWWTRLDGHREVERTSSRVEK